MLKRKTSPINNSTSKKENLEDKLLNFINSDTYFDELPQELYQELNIKNETDENDETDRRLILNILRKVDLQNDYVYHTKGEKICKILNILIKKNKRKWKEFINANLEFFKILILNMFGKLGKNEYRNYVLEKKFNLELSFEFIKNLNHKSIYDILTIYVKEDIQITKENYEFIILLILLGIQNNNFLRKIQKNIENIDDIYMNIKKNEKLLNNIEQNEDIDEEQIDIINDIINNLEEKKKEYKETLPFFIEGDEEEFYIYSELKKHLKNLIEKMEKDIKKVNITFYKNYNIKNGTETEMQYDIEWMEKQVDLYINNKLGKIMENKLREDTNFNEILKRKDKEWKRVLENNKKLIKKSKTLFDENKLSYERKEYLRKKYKFIPKIIENKGTLNVIPEDIFERMIILGNRLINEEIIKRVGILIKLWEKYIIIDNYYNPPLMPGNQRDHELYMDILSNNKKFYNSKKNKKYINSLENSFTKNLEISKNIVENI